MSNCKIHKNKIPSILFMAGWFLQPCAKNESQNQLFDMTAPSYFSHKLYHLNLLCNNYSNTEKSSKMWIIIISCPGNFSFDIISRNYCIPKLKIFWYFSSLYFDISSKQLPIIYRKEYNVKFLGLEKLHVFDSSKWGHIFDVSKSFSLFLLVCQSHFSHYENGILILLVLDRCWDADERYGY